VGSLFGLRGRKKKERRSGEERKEKEIDKGALQSIEEKNLISVKTK